MFHITPLHYLPLILRQGQLLSKSQLISKGFTSGHFRKTSQKSDIDRGFGNYIHLSLQEWPPILKSKLSKGFPHIRFRIKSSKLPKQFDLCRYNIARNRNVKDGKTPATESPKNGFYYENLRVPVARQYEDQIAMLNCSKNQMIEVLIPQILNIDGSTEIECFSAQDLSIVLKTTKHLDVDLKVNQRKLDFAYPKHDDFRQSVSEQIIQYLNKPDWKGDGLDFDKLI